MCSLQSLGRYIMEKAMKKKCELDQKIKQEQASKINKSANELDEESLDSITGGFDQGRSTGGGSRGSVFKPAP